MKTARRDWMFLGVFWVLLAVIGEALVLKADLLPEMYAREAEIGDEAYKLLISLAVPIFAGVAAALLTILVRQVDRRRYDTYADDDDGAHITTNPRLVQVWVGISALLAIGLASKRLYWFASAYLEQDTFQDLKLRNALATGPGYQFLDRGDLTGFFKDMTLWAEAGAAYFNEDFKLADDKSTTRGRRAVKWNWPLWGATR